MNAAARRKWDRQWKSYCRAVGIVPDPARAKAQRSTPAVVEMQWHSFSDGKRMVDTFLDFAFAGNRRPRRLLGPRKLWADRLDRYVLGELEAIGWTAEVSDVSDGIKLTFGDGSALHVFTAGRRAGRVRIGGQSEDGQPDDGNDPAPARAAPRASGRKVLPDPPGFSPEPIPEGETEEQARRRYNRDASRKSKMRKAIREGRG